MWIIVSVFISAMDEPVSMKHSGYPFKTLEECEANLPTFINDDNAYMGRDNKRLFVRHEFPQGWINQLSCIEVWQ